MVHNQRRVCQYVKVHDKTPDLYQDTNWSYDQKILTSEAPSLQNEWVIAIWNIDLRGRGRGWGQNRGQI